MRGGRKSHSGRIADATTACRFARAAAIDNAAFDNAAFNDTSACVESDSPY